MEIYLIIWPNWRYNVKWRLYNSETGDIWFESAYAREFVRSLLSTKKWTIKYLYCYNVEMVTDISDEELRAIKALSRVRRVNGRAAKLLESSKISEIPDVIAALSVTGDVELSSD